MATKGRRVITVTTPDNTKTFEIGVGAKRQVAAVRVLRFDDGSWTYSVHKTLPNAITGPNQSPVWNSCPRWAVEIDANDQPVGPWYGASK